MKYRKLVMLPGALLLLAAAAWSAISTDYDHNANFASYKTYSWGKIDAADSIWEERIKDAISSQFAAKGWTAVSSSGDVVVNAFGKTQ